MRALSRLILIGLIGNAPTIAQVRALRNTLMRVSPMPPIRITDGQYLAIWNAAAALCPADRDQFVTAVAAELQGRPIGDGAVGRAIREAQVRFAHPEPPDVPPRWGRERPRFERASKRAF
jgi:hypothetical protein